MICSMGPDGSFCGKRVQRAHSDNECVELFLGELVILEEDYGHLDQSVLDQVVITVAVQTVDNNTLKMDLTVGDCLRTVNNQKKLGVSSVPKWCDFNLFGDVFMSKVYTAFSYNRGNAEKTRPAIGFGRKARKTQTILI